MTELKEICKVQCGFAFDSKKFTEDDSFSPLIRIRDVKRGFTQTYYTGEFSSEYIVHKGDLLVGMDGEFNIARWNSEDALLNQRVCRIIANSNVNEEYLRFYLKRALKLIESKTSFVTVKHLSAKELNGLKLNLPCMEDQQCISKQLSILELVIRKNKKVLELFDELVKARFVEMFGDPVTNDMLWNTDVLKDICTKIGSGSTPRGGKESYIDEGISLIRSMNVHNAYFEYKDLAHITLDQAEKLNNVVVEHDDLLFNITGASVARCCVVPSDVLPARVNQHVCILRCREKINPIFLQELLVNENCQGKLLQIAKSGATREAINKQQLESLEIMLPPLELQNQFASFVEEIDKSRLRELLAIKQIKLLLNDSWLLFY